MTAGPRWGRRRGDLPAQGEAAEGLKTTLHYADDLDNPENKAFRLAFEAAYKTPADVYGVQGFDTAQLLDIGLKAVGGDVAKQDAFHDAMAKASWKSPRGPFKLSSSHNPIQNFYLRELKGGKNVLLKTAATDLEDPTTGCKLAS